MNKLYSMQSSSLLIGCLLNQPKLLLNNRFSLEGDDFEPCMFHRILFWCIRRLLQTGVESIDEIVLDTFLQGQEEYLEICNDNNFLEVVPNLKLISDPNAIEYYYSTTRKFTTLRYFKDNGYDIQEFFDESKEWDKEMGKLDKVGIEDIINYYDGINAKGKKKFATNSKLKEYKAGESFLETIEEIKDGALIGDSFQSPYLNLICNGIYGFILRSGGSGDGKTVASVGDLMKVSCTHYWDNEAQDFLKNKSFVGASLMINTELSLETELEPMLIAWISNIDRGKIRKWILTVEEEERVLKAREILYSSPIYLVDDSEFTIKSLTTTITDYVLNKGVKNVMFDYLNTNGYIDAELSQEAKIPQRQDMVLQTATDRLKYLQRSLGIGLLSGTQLNAKVQEQGGSPNETWLAGGVSQVRKIDCSIIMCLPTKKELEAYELYRKKQRGFAKTLTPNRVSHIVKGRNSEFPKYIKIFSYLDTGTCRNIDLLLLDKNNKPVRDTDGNIVTSGLIIEKE